jgi:hypothetical protein
MRPSVRFDVFKRDGFTCGYCGRTPPTVTLEVDHIIPVAEGGTDDPENLVTACWDCNRGKGATPLETEPAAIPDLRERAEVVKEREAQLRAYNEVKAVQAERRQRDFDEVWTYWFELWGVDELNRWETPWESSLRRYNDLLGVDEVKDAMRRVRDRFGYPSSKPPKYLGGILKNKLAAAEGRIVACTICGKDVILEPGDDRNAQWHHRGCAEDQRG